MRWATLRVDGASAAARRDGEVYVLTDAVDVSTMLTRRNAGEPLADVGEVPVEVAEYAPVVTRPGKVFCVGLNYRSHIVEMGRDLPTDPTLFAKFASTLCGARDPVAIEPTITEKVDWEAELAVVVGTPLRRASQDEAAKGVAGFAVANDVSMRDWQWRTTQWLPGKVFDASTPVGPELVTPDEVDHARDLEVRCVVDGALRQSGRTSDLVFEPAATLAYISHFCALEPGDLLLTGTPGGVGATTATWLAAGSVVETSVEGVGTCLNTITADS